MQQVIQAVIPDNTLKLNCFRHNSCNATGNYMTDKFLDAVPIA